LNLDQGGTLTGRWPQPAVPIAFHAGDWNSSEMAAIIAAADKWNTFFATSMQYPAIDYGSATSPRTSTSTIPVDFNDFCANQSILDNDDSFSGVVVLYKDGAWNYDTGIIALTTVCKNGVAGKLLPRFHNGFMEINYVNFFVNSNRVPDLQSIVLHEFGHLMGINHSCETSPAGAGIPTCSSAALNSTYRYASMFPTFSFYSNGKGEIRRNLNDNDAGRMNCVYKDL
jgi:hypothetical protein